MIDVERAVRSYAFSIGDGVYRDVLKQALRNSNLSHKEQQDLWLQAASDIPQGTSNNITMAQVPRSMATYSGYTAGIRIGGLPSR